MPSTSKKQHNFMAAVANNPSFAKKVGVPQSVGKDFSKADKGKTFKQGGDMKESKAMVKKEIGFMKAKGAPKSMVKHEMAEMKGAKKMAGGGMPMVMKDGQKVPAFAADGKGKMAHGGVAKKMMGGGMAYAKGGSASSRADGIARKGKTQGTQVKMNRGGKC
jgi:hypothetical protein